MPKLPIGLVILAACTVVIFVALFEERRSRHDEIDAYKNIPLKDWPDGLLEKSLTSSDVRLDLICVLMLWKKDKSISKSDKTLEQLGPCAPMM